MNLHWKLIIKILLLPNFVEEETFKDEVIFLMLMHGCAGICIKIHLIPKFRFLTEILNSTW